MRSDELQERKNAPDLLLLRRFQILSPKTVAAQWPSFRQIPEPAIQQYLKRKALHSRFRLSHELEDLHPSAPSRGPLGLVAAGFLAGAAARRVEASRGFSRNKVGIYAKQH